MPKTDEPEANACYSCGEPMTKKHRVETAQFVRVIWYCWNCDKQFPKKYGDEASRREHNQRWH